MNISITICEMNQPALLNIGLMAARKGAVELEFAVKKLHKLKVEKKGSTDYVTEVDRRVEQIIFEDIKSYYPEHNFLGEESGEEINNSNVTWILDPIDGTTNFINGFPHYCISLCASVDGVPTHGVIIDPTRREEFSASRGKGAQLNGERIRVSDQKNLTDALLSCSSRSTPEQNYKYNLLGTFMELYKNEITIRRTGCSALDLAYIGAGRLDGFWGNGLKPWDVAAGIVIAEEAGALLSDFHGSPKYHGSENIVCCSPKCFKPILQAVESNLEIKT
jgi:myo-inositol-1(or 4)-monophosphatase